MENDKFTFEEILKLILIVLDIMAAIIATILFMTTEPIGILVRILLSILAWIIAIAFLFIDRWL